MHTRSITSTIGGKTVFTQELSVQTRGEGTIVNLTPMIVGAVEERESSRTSGTPFG